MAKSTSEGGGAGEGKGEKRVGKREGKVETSFLTVTLLFFFLSFFPNAFSRFLSLETRCLKRISKHLPVGECSVCRFRVHGISVGGKKFLLAVFPKKKLPAPLLGAPKGCATVD
jgi:hypothetical protein